MLLALALLHVGCTDGEMPEETPAEGTPLYFEPIGSGQRASISDTVEVVLRNQSEWASLRDSLRPPVPFDSVDFGQAIVLMAAVPQTTSGYLIEFSSVEEFDSLVVAEYIVNVPSEDCLTAVADVVPFQAVLVRRTELPVRFERHLEEYRCTFGPRR